MGGPGGCDRWFRWFEASGVVRLWANCEGRRGDVGRSFSVRGTTALRTGTHPCVMHGLSDFRILVFRYQCDDNGEWQQDEHNAVQCA